MKSGLSFGLFGSMALGIWISACEPGSGAAPGGDGDGDGDAGDGDGDDICISNCGDGDGDGIDPDIMQPPAEDCGDSIVDTSREACDDGNNEDGDGCWGNCLGVEPGYICREAGAPCQPIARCGDGAVIFPEQCDDSNKMSGDGCSESCKVEIGYKCDAGAACVKTTCGDAVIEGAEMCEPSLDEGCTSQCQFAPDCSGEGACTSECGDGLVLGEDCDDGNRQNGDGCDETCKVEEGYTCEVDEGECERGANGACILRVPVTYRDFPASHGSFESQTCDVGKLTQGKVEEMLVGGIPQPTDPAICWAVDDWYTSSADNVTFHSEIVLYENGEGGFVNRWGESGETWDFLDPDTAAWAANTYEECAADGCYPCPWGGGAQGCSGDWIEMDGDPFFFPLDGMPGALSDGGTRAKVGPDYGYPSWPFEDEIIGGSPILHNFHFTSEVVFWFPYDADTNATLDFTGDDDVFVFINRRLALDIGGTHTPLNDSFTITGASPTVSGGTGAMHAMEPGNVYEIKVFHAERQTEGSSFRLTLSGFNSRRSDCTAVCGDGIIGFGEECDDGVNAGGYNGCGEDCTLGAFCGDGIKQEDEVCDDADPNAPSSCSGCNIIVVR